VTDTGLLASVVVPVKGDERVRRLIDRLRKQTVPTDAYEVIVVENGTALFADLDSLGAPVRYLHSDEANSATARNLGLAADWAMDTASTFVEIARPASRTSAANRMPARAAMMVKPDTDPASRPRLRLRCGRFTSPPCR
jgi:glycosyltransferase involved in cell wall biosynthesis